MSEGLCVMLLFEHKQQSYNTLSSKQREIFAHFFKDYNKRLVGTTRHSSRVSDITNPKIHINPSIGNTQSMLLSC